MVKITNSTESRREPKIKRIKTTEGIIAVTSIIIGPLILGKYAEKFVIPFMCLAILILAILELFRFRLIGEKHNKRDIITWGLGVISLIVLIWSSVVIFF